MTAPGPVRVLLAAESDDRIGTLTAQIALALPRAVVTVSDGARLAEEMLPDVDAGIVDVGGPGRSGLESVRLLRARGFSAPLVVVLAAPDESSAQSTCQSLGATVVSRNAVDARPVELSAAFATAAAGNAAIAEEVLYARRVFAAGQMALSLQHSINNPLAALLAEAQLLQLEELSPEQRGSVDRMVELCRRIVALVRRLDGLAAAG